jgi:protein transport protein SEC24
MTKGLRAEAFHGNFFVRSSDLLALPCVSPDNSYFLQLAIDEPLETPFACFQSALLYTTDFGERRIRIVTSCLPVTSDMKEIFMGVDQFALINFLSKMSIERALTSKLEDAREALVNKLVDVLGIYKTVANTQQLSVCENLYLLPIMVLALVKHRVIRSGTQVPLDIRTHMMNIFRILPVELSTTALVPNLYEIHEMGPDVGQLLKPLESPNSPLPRKENKFVFPKLIPPTGERLSPHGIYLLDNIFEIFLYVGRQASPYLVQSLFGVPYESIQTGKVFLPLIEESDLNIRVHKIIDHLTGLPSRKNLRSDFLIVKEDGGEPLSKLMFLSNLVFDRSDFGPSYAKFLGEVGEKVSKGSF